MCDGYSGYNKVPDAKRTACWAHIRRYLTDAVPKGKELDYSQPSVQGIMYINQLFHMEEVIKAKQTSFDAIRKARLEKEKPIVEGFLSWLDKQNPVRGSRMDKAVTYIKNRRSYLATYCNAFLRSGVSGYSDNTVSRHCAIYRHSVADKLLLQSGTGNTSKYASGAAGNIAPSGCTGKETSGIERTTG